MSDDIDVELELARGRARARQRKEAEARPQAPSTHTQAPRIPEGGSGWFEPASSSGAILSGVGQGASLGFADELAGGVRGLSLGFARKGVDALKTPLGRPVLRALYPSLRQLPDAAVDAVAEQGLQQSGKDTLGMSRVPEDPDAALEAGYVSGRNEARLENVQAQRAHPVTSLLSTVAGGVLLPGPKLGKAGAAGRLAALAKSGGQMGGLTALGTSNADLTKGDVSGAVGDSALGYATGAVLAPAAAIGSDKASRFLKNASLDNALKAIGLRAGISNQLAQRGYETVDDARELAQSAIDQQLIRPFRTASDVAERAGFAKQVQGSRIQAVMDDADKAAARETERILQQNQAARSAAKPGTPTWDQPTRPAFDTDRASWDAASEVMGPDGLTTEAMSKARPAARVVDRIAQQGEVEPSFRAANQLKSDIYDGINYATEPGLSTRLQRRAASGLRKSIEEQVAERTGVDAADELRAANKAYGFLSDIQPLAQDEATRQAGRKGMTALDWASTIGGGSAAGMAAGPLTGLGAGAGIAAVKLLGPRMPSTLAVAQNALAPRVPGLVQGLLKPALQVPMRPSLKDDEDAINAFLTGG